jgi:uncharacterized protein YbcI
MNRGVIKTIINQISNCIDTNGFSIEISFDHINIDFGSSNYNPYVVIKLFNSLNSPLIYRKLVNRIHSILAENKCLKEIDGQHPPDLHITLGRIANNDVPEVHRRIRHPKNIDDVIYPTELLINIKNIISESEYCVNKDDNQVINIPVVRSELWHINRKSYYKDGNLIVKTKRTPTHIIQHNTTELDTDADIVRYNTRQKLSSYDIHFSINNDTGQMEVFFTESNGHSFIIPRILWKGEVPDKPIELVYHNHNSKKKRDVILCSNCYSRQCEYKHFQSHSWEDIKQPENNVYCVLHSLRKWVIDERNGFKS